MNLDVRASGQYPVLHSMHGLQRWMKKELANNSPSLLVTMGVVCTLPLMAEAALVIDQNWGLALAAPAVALAGWSPLIVRQFQVGRDARRRGKLIERMLRLPSRYPLGKWEEVLQCAAADHEQIGTLLVRADYDKVLRDDLRKEVDARMRRIFDLSTGAPGELGFSTEGALIQIEADLAWLTKARELVEATTTILPSREPDGMLAELRLQTDSRKAALRELLSGLEPHSESTTESVKTL